MKAGAAVLLSWLSLVPVALGQRMWFASDEDIVEIRSSSHFNEKVLDSPGNGYYVQFYSDHCYYCRSFAPDFRRLARSLRPWQPVVRIAAINCDRNANVQACIDNYVYSTPTIKYFHSRSSHADDGHKVKVWSSVGRLETDIASQVLIDDLMNGKRNRQWPNFGQLDPTISTNALWNKVPDGVNYLAVFVDDTHWSFAGMKAMLDLSSSTDRVYMRRTVKGRLAQQLGINDTPGVALIARRNKNRPVYKSGLNKNTVSAIKNEIK